MTFGQEYFRQYVRAPITLGPIILVISLTFVRNTKYSHGRVGKTTGFWSSIESRHLAKTIYFNDTVSNHKFQFSYSYHFIPAIFKRCLVIWTADFWRHFVLILLIFFSRSQRNLWYFPNYFSRQITFRACKCSFCQGQASTRKHQNTFVLMLSVIWDNTFWHKIMIPLPLQKYFRYRKLSETWIGSTRKFLVTLRLEFILTKLVILPLGIVFWYQNF